MSFCFFWSLDVDLGVIGVSEGAEVLGLIGSGGANA